MSWIRIRIQRMRIRNTDCGNGTGTGIIRLITVYGTGTDNHKLVKATSIQIVIFLKIPIHSSCWHLQKNHEPNQQRCGAVTFLTGSEFLAGSRSSYRLRPENFSTTYWALPVHFKSIFKAKVTKKIFCTFSRGHSVNNKKKSKNWNKLTGNFLCDESILTLKKSTPCGPINYLFSNVGYRLNLAGAGAWAGLFFGSGKKGRWSRLRRLHPREFVRKLRSISVLVSLQITYWYKRSHQLALTDLRLVKVV